MGVSSNLEVFLSEKHLNNNKDREEFIITTSLTASSAMEEETSDQEQSHHDDDLIKTKQQTVQVQEQEKNSVNNDNNNNVPLVLLPSASSPDLGLKIKIPPYNVEEGSSSSSSSDGFKTPTGPEHRIPSMLECPPAPKKPKTTPSSTAKRKGCYCHGSRVALIDFSQEDFDDSLFPSTPSVVDRCSHKIKSKKVKVKLFTDDDQPPQ